MKLHTVVAYLAVGSCAWSGSAFAALDYTVDTAATVSVAAYNASNNVNYVSQKVDDDRYLQPVATSSATAELSFGSNFASASATDVADSGNGTLRIGNFATASGQGEASAGGRASIVDVLYFAYTGNALLSMHVVGDITIPLQVWGDRSNYFGADLSLARVGSSPGDATSRGRANASIQRGYGEDVTTTNSVCQLSDTHFVCDLSFVLLVTKDLAYDFSAGIGGGVAAGSLSSSTSGEDRQFVDVMKTATINFSGVSFQSESGLLFSTRQNGNVPEPATLLLFGLGLAGLGAVSRRRVVR